MDPSLTNSVEVRSGSIGPPFERAPVARGVPDFGHGEKAHTASESSGYETLAGFEFLPMGGKGTTEAAGRTAGVEMSAIRT
jgi:hypothetical protein